MPTYRRPLWQRDIRGHRPLVDLYLLAWAFACRVGLTRARCHVCGAVVLTRWPWQGRVEHMNAPGH